MFIHIIHIAERATTMILFADSYLAQGGDASYITNTLKPGKSL